MLRLAKKYPADTALLVAFFVLNLVLRLLFAASRDIAMDEPFSIFLSQQDLTSIFKILSAGNNPPLHFLGLHYWMKIFGDSAFSVRFMSVLFTSVSAAMIYLTGRRFFSRFTGIAAASIFTFSTMQMYFSHEARVYPLFFLLAVLSLYTCLLINQGGHSKWNFIMLFVWNILLLYAHYFGFFVILCEIVSLIVFGGMRRMYKKMIVVFVLLGIAYLPFMLVLYSRLGVLASGTWVKPPAWTELYGNLNLFLNTRYNALVLIFLFAVTLFFLIRRKKMSALLRSFFKSSKILMVIIWFVLPYLLMFFISFVFPMFIDRYILFTSAPFYLFIAIAMNHFMEEKVVAWSALVVLVLSMVFTVQLNPDNKRSVVELVAYTRAQQGADGLVIISPEYADLEFAYHYNINYFRDYRNTRALLQKDNIFPTRDIAGIPVQNLKNASHIIYVDCGTRFAFGNNPVYDSLSKNSTKISTHGVYEIYRVSVFDGYKK